MTHAAIAGLEDQFRRIAEPQIVKEPDLQAIPSGPRSPPGMFIEPEDRGLATLSPLGDVEYVEDLIRPGRILVWAAEEGSGKSYTVAGELGIRVALAGGLFAGTWRVLQRGPVLYLSEMHPDDDFGRETTVLASLNIGREDLSGLYYRLPLMTAAGGQPVLTVPEWRSVVVEWLRHRRALLLIFDTATGATLVDPWGREIQAVYRDLRLMLEDYPQLAIVLVVHLKKPSGRGQRRISDVLGEWGRWCDVLVVQENDGANLERSKLSVRKRVRRERHILATKSGGLLIDPAEVAGGSAPKVGTDEVMVAIAAAPGMTYGELGKRIGVSKDTAARYAKSLGDRVSIVPSDSRGTLRIYPTTAPPQIAVHAPAVVDGFGDPTAAPPRAPV